jgi:tetratricopeptide (TPR) repeat protein
VDDPDDSIAHGLLALTLCDLERPAEALQAASEAMRLAPDGRLSLLALSNALLSSGRLDEAAQAAQDLIAHEPFDTGGFKLLARVRLAQGRPEEALESAEQALAVDPESGDAASLRNVALLRLGRRDEAAQGSGEAVAREPESAVAHNVRGWALLHAGDAEQALVHFREALRLDPTLDNAREGLVLALKARHRTYSLVLSYFLWLERMPPRRRQALLIGAFVGVRILAEVGGHGIVLDGLVTVVVVAYLLFLLALWLADPLFNLILRFSKHGRDALAPRDRLSADLLGSCLLAGVLCLAAGLALGRVTLLAAAAACCLLGVPSAVIARASPGWPRTVTVVWGAGTAALLVAGVVAALADAGPIAGVLIAFSIIGSLLSTWFGVLPEQRRGRGLQRFKQPR